MCQNEELAVNEYSYTLNDGAPVTLEQIKEACEAGDAVLVHYHRPDGWTGTGLMLDGKHFDTRGECFSMWEEQWTRNPTTLTEALEAAR